MRCETQHGDRDALVAVRLAHLAFLCASLSVFASCGGDSPVGTAAGHVASIRFSPAQPAVDVGHAVQVVATPLDAGGRELAGVIVTWDVPSGALVSVSSVGLVTGVGVGVDTVYAVVDAFRAPVVITVGAVQIASVVITPSTVGLQLANALSSDDPAPVTLVPTVKNSYGELVPSAFTTWTSSNTDVVQVSAAGVLSAIGVGAAIVTAQAGATQATVPVTVQASSLSIQSGTATVRSTTVTDVSVGAGAQLWLSGSTTIRSVGPVVIDGAVGFDGIGPCNFSIITASTVTIRGLMSITCGLRIVAGAGIVLADARIFSQGAQRYTNDSTLAAADYMSPTPIASSNCEVSNSVLQVVRGPTAVTGNANPIEVFCRGDVILAGTTRVVAQRGPVRGQDLRAGVARIRATRDVVVRGTQVSLASGNGGDAEPQYAATGGVGDRFNPPKVGVIGANGGNVGDSTFLGAPVSVGAGRDLKPDAPGAALLLIVGRGGSGASVYATGVTGGIPSPDEGAGVGGSVDATGGRGGDTFPPLTVVGGTAAGVLVNISGGTGGIGGDAVVYAGNGGSGNAKFPNGAGGGDFTARAGSGGNSRVIATAGNALSAGGTPGIATLSGGNGGAGWNSCLAPGTAAGVGGHGGSGSAFIGLPGTGEVNGARVDYFQIQNAGNGGVGGNGIVPAAGGLSGMDMTAPPVQRHASGFTFARGSAGTGCP